MTNTALDISKLIEENRKYMHNVALRVVKNEQDAEDVVQEASLKAFNNSGNFNGDANPKTWLHAIVFNTALNFYSKKRFDTSSVDDEEVYVQLSSDISPEDVLIHKEAYQAFLDQIKGLSTKYQSVLTLWAEGNSYDEISEELGWDYKTVKSRLHRARKQIENTLL